MGKNRGLIFLLIIVQLVLKAEAARDVPWLRVGLSAQPRAVVVDAPGGFKVTDLTTKHSISVLEPLIDFTIIPGHNGLKIIGEGIWSKKIEIAPLRSEYLLINSRKYPGTIEIIDEGRKVSLVNTVDIESYVEGVVNFEVSANWPAAAIESQAIVARTYALANLGRHSRDGYDLCDTIHCQVYGGWTRESKRSAKIIRQSRGVIITYQGEAIQAYCHACSGGYTESPENVWNSGQRYPYLCGVWDPYTKSSPHYDWELKVPLTEIQKLLREKGYPVGEIYGVRPQRISETGRLIEVKIIHSKGDLVLNANKFRLLIGRNRFKSTLCKMRLLGDKMVFTGHGWGHGVGFSQWGAKGMAEKGYKTPEIIRHYFPGTRLEKRWE